MKLLLTGMTEGLDELKSKLFNNLKDPINVKKTKPTIEEKAFYEHFLITHTLDVASFLSYADTFVSKYVAIIKEENDRLEGFDDLLIRQSKTLFAKKAHDRTTEKIVFSGLAKAKLEDVWYHNISLKKNNELVEFYELMQQIVPEMTYHFYQMSFSRINATTYDSWKQSMFKIIEFMDCCIDYNKQKEVLEKKYPIIKRNEVGNYTWNVQSFSKVGAMHQLIPLMEEDKKTVFWGRSRKRETRDEYITGFSKNLEHNASLLNYMLTMFEMLKERYNVNHLRELRDNNENLEFSLVDMTEKINYRQFFLESSFNRTLVNNLDEIDISDVRVLREHGVNVQDIKRDLSNFFGDKNFGAPYLCSMYDKQKYLELATRNYHEYALSDALMEDTNGVEKIVTKKKKI